MESEAPRELTPGRAKGQDRETEALRLRVRGLSSPQIAVELQVSARTVQRLVQRALGRLSQPDHLELRARRELEADRLDAAQAALWDKVSQGDAAAIGAFLKISERRSKLLGLDAPVKIAPTDPSGEEPYDIAAALERKLALLAAAGGADGVPQLSLPRGTAGAQLPLDFLGAGEPASPTG